MPPLWQEKQSHAIVGAGTSVAGVGSVSCPSTRMRIKCIQQRQTTRTLWLHCCILVTASAQPSSADWGLGFLTADVALGDPIHQFDDRLSVVSTGTASLDIVALNEMLPLSAVVSEQIVLLPAAQTIAH